MYVIRKTTVNNDIFLVDTRGYGPSWTKDESEAWRFDSRASASRAKQNLLINSAEIVLTATNALEG